MGLGGMKCYFINLASAGERRRHMYAVFSAQGLALERIEGVLGAALPPEEIAAFHARSLTVRPDQDRLGPGEIGCLMSHLAVLRRIAEGDEPWAVVLEDDVHISPDLARFVGDDSWIPADCDVVRLETNLRSIRRTGPVVGTAHGRTLRRLTSWQSGSGGYVVSRAAAARLLAVADRLVQPSDKMLFDNRHWPADGLRVVQVIPALVIQDMMVSRRAGRRGFTPFWSVQRVGHVAPLDARRRWLAHLQTLKFRIIEPLRHRLKSWMMFWRYDFVDFR